MLLAMEDYAIATRLMPSKTEALFKHGLHYFNNGYVFLYWLVSFNFLHLRCSRVKVFCCIVQKQVFIFLQKLAVSNSGLY